MVFFWAKGAFCAPQDPSACFSCQYWYLASTLDGFQHDKRLAGLRTSSPSRTRMSSTMPPSRCCTILRSFSILIVPGATTAPLIWPKRKDSENAEEIRISHKPWRTLICLGLSIKGFRGRSGYRAGFPAAFLAAGFRSQHSDQVDLCNGMRGRCFNWFLVIRRLACPSARIPVWLYGHIVVLACWAKRRPAWPSIPHGPFWPFAATSCWRCCIFAISASPGRAGPQSTIWPLRKQA